MSKESLIGLVFLASVIFLVAYRTIPWLEGEVVKPDAPIIIPPAPEPTPPAPNKNNLMTIKSDEEFARLDKRAVFDFYADWCGPCRQMSPIIERLARENPAVMFYKVDVDACPNAAKSHSVEGIPTILVGDKRFVGVTAESKLQFAIDSEIRPTN